ncbi:Vacuolar protein-sorting-associated protein 27, partial [Spiromyces aspiralis]
MSQQSATGPSNLTPSLLADPSELINPFPVDKLTDENIPGHQLNLGDALDFADKVRSKEYVPREVARLLKGRLAHQNPNVQLMALQLTDVIIKNGGDRFLVEISSRDFVQNLVGIIRHSVYSYELYSESLKYLQEWAVLCQGNAELAAIYNAYSQLKREGFPFPKTASVSKAMIETHTARSAESLVPPKSKDEEDEELRRAIELSLKETQRHSASHPTYQQRQGQQSAPGEPYPLPLQEDGEYEPDREMRAAIEASLREMRISGPQAPEQFPVTEEAYHQGVVEGEERVHQQMNHFMPGADAPSSSSLSPSANEISDDNPLTSIEQENVSLFEDLLQ